MIYLGCVTNFQLNSNEIYETIVDYYRVAVFIPLLDSHVRFSLFTGAIGVPQSTANVLVDSANRSVSKEKRVYSSYDLHTKSGRKPQFVVATLVAIRLPDLQLL